MEGSCSRTSEECGQSARVFATAGAMPGLVDKASAVEKALGLQKRMEARRLEQLKRQLQAAQENDARRADAEAKDRSAPRPPLPRVSRAANGADSHAPSPAAGAPCLAAQGRSGGVRHVCDYVEC